MVSIGATANMLSTAIVLASAVTYVDARIIYTDSNEPAQKRLLYIRIACAIIGAICLIATVVKICSVRNRRNQQAAATVLPTSANPVFNQGQPYNSAPYGGPQQYQPGLYATNPGAYAPAPGYYPPSASGYPSQGPQDSMQTLPGYPRNEAAFMTDSKDIPTGPMGHTPTDSKETTNDSTNQVRPNLPATTGSPTFSSPGGYQPDIQSFVAYQNQPAVRYQNQPSVGYHNHPTVGCRGQPDMEYQIQSPDPVYRTSFERVLQ
ncbi:hypothetical protein C8J56DRAFT_1172729 [Mycena floridula]|nr:hypothetical protein C8J56DRAFT_1172729 [Mycena floridula]